MHDTARLIIESFLDLKDQLSAARGIQSLLHVHIGLVVFAVAALLLRRMLAYMPLLVVVVIQAANETMDWLIKPGFRLSDSLFDSVNTLVWPSLLTLMIVYHRRRLAALTPPRRPGQSVPPRPLQSVPRKSSDDDVREAIKSMLRGMDC
ncbi:hypothetical protein [Sphingobium xenophagum]|nr:hypothetical protein [Sphingobium xenophagum]